MNARYPAVSSTWPISTKLAHSGSTRTASELRIHPYQRSWTETPLRVEDWPISESSQLALAFLVFTVFSRMRQMTRFLSGLDSLFTLIIKK